MEWSVLYCKTARWTLKTTINFITKHPTLENLIVSTAPCFPIIAARVQNFYHKNFQMPCTQENRILRGWMSVSYCKTVRWTLKITINFITKYPILENLIVSTAPHFPITAARVQNFYNKHFQMPLCIPENIRSTIKITKTGLLEETIDWENYADSVKIIYQKLSTFSKNKES